MERSRGLAVTATLLVVVVAVVSGPLVGAVDLSTEPTWPAPPGQGSADVQVVDVPGTAVLERGDFGAGTYHLTGPSPQIEVGSVTGNPLLEFVIHIPRLGFTDIKSVELRRVPHQTVEPDYRPVELSPSLIDRASYNGTIEIRLQSDEFEILAEAPVTVEVQA